MLLEVLIHQQLVAVENRCEKVTVLTGKTINRNVDGSINKTTQSAKGMVMNPERLRRSGAWKADA